MIHIHISDPRRILASVERRYLLFVQFLDHQFEDSNLCFLHNQVLRGES